MHQSLTYSSVPIDEIEDIRRRMRISNLEARLALQEIEAAALNREINSPLTYAQKREDATRRRDFALTEASAIKAELDEMYRTFPYWLDVSWAERDDSRAQNRLWRYAAPSHSWFGAKSSL
jgi:uncharacterized coiled-coil protein SlyX